MMMPIEHFLRELRQPIHIVGGSPLFTGRLPDNFISINAKHPIPQAYAAAINGSTADARRAKDWEFVLQPNPEGKQRLAHAMQTDTRYAAGILGPKIQPTTYFALAAICWSLGIRCEMWGICGWASKWHDGDLEMHHLKHMRGVIVHDPRPQW